MNKLSRETKVFGADLIASQRLLAQKRWGFEMDVQITLQLTVRSAAAADDDDDDCSTGPAAVKLVAVRIVGVRYDANPVDC